jgi:hypothetical protein
VLKQTVTADTKYRNIRLGCILFSTPSRYETECIREVKSSEVKAELRSDIKSEK